MKNKLNLGCGPDYRQEYWNVDLLSFSDEKVDLQVFPWPWADDKFYEILAYDIIEHIFDTVGFMNECWRVIRPGGKLLIRTPSWDAEFAYIDPTHVKVFALDTFDFFDPSTPYGDYNKQLTDKKWKVVSKVKTENSNLEFELKKI